MGIISGSHSTVDTDHEVYSNLSDPEIVVGDYTQIGPGTIYCGSINHPWIKHRESVSTFSFSTCWHMDYLEPVITRGNITIGSDVWIGKNVSILDGVHIGDGAIVGAFAVVAKDVPPYAVVVGNPAKIVHYRFTPEQIEKLLEIKWWELKEDIIRELLPMMKDVDKFIEYYEKNSNKFGADSRN